MTRYGILCVAAFLLAFCAPSQGEPFHRIIVDGQFGDWAPVPSQLDSANDTHDTDHGGQFDVPAYVQHEDVDLLEFKFTHDEENLYAYFKSTGEIGRTQAKKAGNAGRYYVIVTIDVDDNDSTGYWLHEGGYYPTSPGYDMNMEVEFYNSVFNTGHYLNHGCLNESEYLAARIDQAMGIVDVRPGTYDWYTQWVWWDEPQGIPGEIALPTGERIVWVVDRGPVYQGIIRIEVSPDGHEAEMVAPFRGFMNYPGGAPIIADGATLDVSFSLEASGELAPGNDWASDTAPPIEDYYVNTGPVIRVDKASTSPAPDGSSWADAYTTLQDAILHSAILDGCQIWVREGVYNEARTSTIGGVNSGALVLLPNVALYGGFDGTETQLHERDWVANPTIIDGSASRGGQAAYHVVYGGQNAVLNGFTVTGGNANAVPGGVDIHSIGGGLLAWGATMRVENCVFTANTAEYGGAIAVASAGGLFENCSVWDNSAAVGAGGAFSFNAAPIFNNCHFDQNTGAYSGAVDVWLGSPRFERCVFSWNNGIYGGGLFVWNSAPRFKACSFFDNVGDLGSGSVFSYESDSTFDGCRFTREDGFYGGALSNWNCSPTVTNCVMEDGTSHLGAAMFNTGCDITVRNSTFVENTAAAAGGAIFNTNSACAAANAILYANGPDQAYHDGTGGVTMSYSDIQGGWPGTGNISGNPQLDANRKPMPGSPCINTGSTAAAAVNDIAGIERPTGAGADMGAFEQ